MFEGLKLFFSRSYTKYLLVGGGAFALDYGLLLLSHYVLNINLSVSTSIGFISGFLFSFTLNREWAFAKQNKRRAHNQIIEYSLLVIFNYFFTLVFINFLSSVAPVFLLKPAAVGLITVWNYLAYKHLIFREEPSDEKP